MSDDVRYHRVNPTIWSQPWSNDAKLLALYMLTCDHRNTEGLYRLPKLYVRADLGWDAKRLEAAWEELLGDGFIEWAPDQSVVLIVNALRVQTPANDNMAKHAVKQLALVPKSPLDARFGALAERYCERLAERLPERFTEPFAEPTPNPQALALTPTPQPPAPSDDDAPDEVEQQFNDHFWPIYPPTNGVKRDKQGALREWRKLTLEERRAAVKGAKNKASHFQATGEEPPYAVRFLRRRDFEDYQQPVVVDKATGDVRVVADSGPTCPQCAQRMEAHDLEVCRRVREDAA